MVEHVVVGIVAGFLAGISPCILPVLPVVLVAGASTPASASTPADVGTAAAETSDNGEAPARMPRAGLARSLAVIGGLVLSFSIIVLAGSEILSLSLPHLPQDALRDAGIALLIVVGLGYLITPLGTLIERPFARVGTRRPSGRAGGFVLGLAVGVLYVPWAGPVLAAIAGLQRDIPGYTTALQGSAKIRNSSRRSPALRTPHCPAATRPPPHW